MNDCISNIQKISEIQTKVLHPSYYGDSVYEAIKVIYAWKLNFSLGSAIKYICRAGKKEGNSALQDLIKARNYINFEIDEILSHQQDSLEDLPSVPEEVVEKAFQTLGGR